MPGIGVTEVLIIIALAVVVFGGPMVIGYWLGYQSGKRVGGASGEDQAQDAEAHHDATDTDHTSNQDAEENAAHE
jgi:hypothetical protein